MQTLTCGVRLLLLLLAVGHTNASHRIPLRPRFRPLDTGPLSTSGSLRNFEGVQFYGDVAVGTPAQTLPVLFDTGSFETWFPTTSFCQKVKPCTTSGFESTSSKSFLGETNSFQVKYLSSSVYGVYGQDYVAFGELSTQSVIDIGLIEKQVGSPDQHAFDGLVGMGPNSSFVQSTLDKAVADRQGERRMFSFYLSDSADGGSMTLGGYDEKHIAGSANSSLVWFESYAVRSSWSLPYWILPSLVVAYSGETIASNSAVVIDSGTSFILGPQAAVTQIYNLAGNVDASGAIECWRILSLPVLSLMIGTKRYDLKPEQYAYRGDDNWTCNIGIMPHYAADDKWILGDVFMLNFLSVFSLEDPATTANAARPATLPKEDGVAQVRHWIGLAPVYPPRNVQFPSASWFNSLAFFRIVIIVVVVAILATLALIGRFVGRSIYRAFRRIPPGQSNNANVNA